MFVLPGYKILGMLGRGGMAIDYKARQLRLQRLVAVKVIDSSLANDQEIVARFRQEQVLTARLMHPNLVAAYGAGRAVGCPYLIMEFVPGDDLETLGQRHGPLPVAGTCEIIGQAALGLQHRHEQGLVHRDVKPSNLMLTPSGPLRCRFFRKSFHIGPRRHRGIRTYGKTYS